MKSNKTLALFGLLSLETLLGCGERFPQYSGAYQLQSSSYTDPSFAGKQQLPASLELTDRMEYYGSYWNHHLKFNFIPQDGNQAAGIFSLKLNDITRIDDGAWPNNWYNGAEIYREPEVYGTGAFCNYQYLYFLFMQSAPSYDILQNTYPRQGECIGKDPTTHMPLCTSLAHPQEVDFNDTGWYDAIDENEGITLTLTFSRYIRGDTSGSGNSNDCILPPDPKNRGEAYAVFVYRASRENLDDKVDVRKAPLEIPGQNASSLSFFTKIVSNIK